MLEEMTVAARWWALHIQPRSTDTDFERRKTVRGDTTYPLQSAAHRMTAGSPPAQVFERAVTRLLSQKCTGHWYPEDARRASGYRAIVNDLRCDPILEQAAAKAGIEDIHERLPMNHRMFVNPGSVSIREGEDDSIILYDQVKGVHNHAQFANLGNLLPESQQSQTFVAPQAYMSDEKHQFFQKGPGQVSYAIVYNGNGSDGQYSGQAGGVQHFDIGRQSLQAAKASYSRTASGNHFAGYEQ
jgi:hypothetical protein